MCVSAPKAIISCEGDINVIDHYGVTRPDYLATCMLTDYN